uniref:Uncharacterized protein n=1 Tax=Anguilla anguilla TaxID=7936 RepID=A0A0E9UBF1_ANGAN
MNSFSNRACIYRYLAKSKQSSAFLSLVECCPDPTSPHR